MPETFEERVISAIAELRIELRTELKNISQRFRDMEARLEKMENKIDQRVEQNGTQNEEITRLQERVLFLEHQQKIRLKVTLAWATAIISAIATVASVLIQTFFF